MNTDKETSALLKETIKTLVDQKVKLTRDRCEYKLRTRPLLQTGETTEGKRRRFFGNIDSDRAHLKYTIRHSLLLYGYIRGRSYDQIEPKCRKGNSPSWPTILKIAGKSGFEITENQCMEWLAGEPSPHRRERRDDNSEAA